MDEDEDWDDDDWEEFDEYEAFDDGDEFFDDDEFFNNIDQDEKEWLLEQLDEHRQALEHDPDADLSVRRLSSLLKRKLKDK